MRNRVAGMQREATSLSAPAPADPRSGDPAEAPAGLLKEAFTQMLASVATSRRQPAPQGSFGEQIQFLSRSYEELDVTLDPNARALWCHMRPNGPPSFTPSMVRELIVLHRAVQSLMAAQPPGEEPLIRYYVQGSRIPGIYNMGGDLAFLTERIRMGDRESVRRYAYDCVDAVYHIAIGFDSSIVTVGLLQGDALGGGLEGAICCNYLIAERSAKMGLPEVLFNSFPGMGAYSLLARRLDAARAERMILSGQVYSAQQMHDMGIVDEVVPDGEGEDAVRAYIGRDHRQHATRAAIYRARQRINPLTLAELREITDMWVDVTMKLPAADLRRMSLLQSAQVRRLQREVKAPSVMP